MFQQKKVVLSSVYVILLAELLAIIHNSAVDNYVLLAACSAFLLTALRPFWGIWIFVAFVPLINGLLQLHEIVGIYIIFTTVYLAWLPRYLFKESRGSNGETLTSFLAYLLAAAVFLNLCLSLFRFTDWPLPSKYWFDWMSSFVFSTQSELLWQISAALILLKGIVLFQMIAVEINSVKRWEAFTKTIYVQGIVIVGFSIYQLIIFKTNGVKYLGLTLPFSDIHSYGSTVILLFFIFLYFLLDNIKKQRIISTKLSRNSKISLNIILDGVLVVAFFILCLYSSSRIAWLSMVFVLSLILIKIIRRRKVLIVIFSIILAFVFAGNLFMPRLLKSKNISLRRFGTILNIQDILSDKSLVVRYELWDRSKKMVLDYPLTGVGVGNVYRNIQAYKSRTLKRADRENSHNYYIQFAAELGLPLLCLFISILLSLFTVCKSAVKNQFKNIISLAPFRYGLGAYLLTMITGHPLLIISQQFLFWPVVAIISKGQFLQEETDGQNATKRRILKSIGLLCFFLYIIGISVNLYKKDPWTIPATYGFYSDEKWEDYNIRWMSKKAQYYLPAERKNLYLKITAHPFNSSLPEGLKMKIYINDALVENLHFFNGGSKFVGLGLRSENGKDVKLTFEVDRVFSPIKSGISQDRRLLGVAIREIDKLPTIPAIQTLILK